MLVGQSRLFYRLLTLLCILATIGGARAGLENVNAGDFPSRSPPSGMPVAQAIIVDRCGELSGCSIPMHELALDLKLPLRDLRLVDPSFPGQVQAGFSARPNVLLFALENIKVIVREDCAMVFGPDRPEVGEFVPALQAQLRSVCGTESALRFEHRVLETALSTVCGNLSRKVKGLAPAIATALHELQAESRGLDIIQTQVDGLLPLKNQLDELRKRTKEVERAIKEVLDNDADMALMHLGPTIAASTTTANVDSENTAPTDLDALDLHLQQRGTTVKTAGIEDEESGEMPPASLNPATQELQADSLHQPSNQPLAGEFRSRRGGLRVPSVLHRSSHINHGPHSHITGLRTSSPLPLLPHRPSPQPTASMDATMSLEILLENYLKEVGWVGSEIDEHLDKIINTEENVALQIDLLRNRILRFELALSMSSFIVACAALVTGLFGMNLLSHLEHHPAVFWAVAGTLGAGMVVSWHQLRRYGKRERLF